MLGGCWRSVAGGQLRVLDCHGSESDRSGTKSGCSAVDLAVLGVGVAVLAVVGSDVWMCWVWI